MYLRNGQVWTVTNDGRHASRGDSFELAGERRVQEARLYFDFLPSNQNPAASATISAPPPISQLIGGPDDAAGAVIGAAAGGAAAGAGGGTNAGGVSRDGGGSIEVGDPGGGPALTRAAAGLGADGLAGAVVGAAAVAGARVSGGAVAAGTAGASGVAAVPGAAAGAAAAGGAAGVPSATVVKPRRRRMIPSSSLFPTTVTSVADVLLLEVKAHRQEAFAEIEVVARRMARLDQPIVVHHVAVGALLRPALHVADELGHAVLRHGQIVGVLRLVGFEVSARLDRDSSRMRRRRWHLRDRPSRDRCTHAPFRSVLVLEADGLGELIRLGRLELIQ